MKVKIVKCSDNQWYTNRIGEIYEVYEECNPDYYSLTNGVLILKSETFPVNEIRYELKSTVIYDTCVTSCEHKKNTMVGSVGCSECEYNCGNDKEAQTVQCSWQMNLKSIAVRFENMKQYKAIIEKFKANGFKLSIATNIYTSGEVGYTSALDYVCVLTESALKGRKIISYEEFMGGKEMKRLNIRKDYEDSKISTSRYFSISNSKEYTRVQIGEDLHFRLNGDVTLDQANAILKVMGLDYELYESVNWQEIEVGSKVKITTECSIFNAKFHSYIPNLNKIVVIQGKDVKVYDESEIEVCE